jgi:hypothetical protein
MADGIDSGGWTGGGEAPQAPFRDHRGQLVNRVGLPISLPHHVEMRTWLRHHPQSTADQSWGRGHSVLLLASPLLLWFADWLLRLLIGDYPARVPDAGYSLWLAAPAGLILYAAMRWEKAAPVLRRVAQAGWIAATALMAVYVAIGVQDYDNAAAGPVLRAQIVGTHRQSRHGPYESMFALQDGSIVGVIGLPGGRNCYAVRRLEGAHGFAWLRIVEMPPAPHAGQLNWPIDRAACFSAAPLASLRG